MTSAEPVWSVFVPACDRTTYLRFALGSVLDSLRDEPAAEIVVVDNSSNEGGVEAVAREFAARGVRYVRHPKQLSMAANWNSCLDLARGRYVHLLHDDDAVLPSFYPAYRQRLEANLDLGLLFSPVVEIDTDGTWTRVARAPVDLERGRLRDPSHRLAQACLPRTPSVVVPRRVYDEIGRFSEGLSYTPDWQMWLRIATRWPIGCLSNPHSLYRVHPGSETARLSRAGRTLLEQVEVTRFALSLLSPEVAAEIRLSAFAAYARVAKRTARRLRAAGDVAAGLRFSELAHALAPTWKTRLRVWVARWRSPRAASALERSYPAEASRRGQPIPLKNPTRSVR